MYTSNDLATAVKRRANVPTSQITFQPADFYALADEELRSKILPLMLKVMEEYFVTSTDLTIVPGQNKYLIPTRAIAGRLRDVELVSIANPDNRIGLDRIEPDMSCKDATLPERIWAIKNAKDDTVIRYLVGREYQVVFDMAVILTGLKASDLTVEDTGQVKDKCCGECP